MKVLSIIEPWATLIASKQKYIETRSWKTSYRGELYIHASKKLINTKDKKIKELLKLLPTQEMNYGKIICKCELVDCIYMDEKFINEIKQNKTNKNIYVETTKLEGLHGYWKKRN